MSLNDQLKLALNERKSTHLYRSRQVLQSPQGIDIKINGKRYLNFCSNDYLGLANHPEIIEALKAGADRYGVGSGAAHLVTGHAIPHHALEEELADFVKRPRALLFSTGYMANLGVVGALLDRNDAVFEDRLNHASLIDAGMLSRAQLLRYQHADAQSLKSHLSQAKAGNRLIVTDGVFSMDGDMAPLPELATMAKQHDSWLMVDDAHGLGVTGRTGRGTLEHFDMAMNEVPVLVGTLGKAFGTFGAFVAGSEELIETLIQHARSYIYTTALPPAIAEATRKSLERVKQDGWRREKLHHLIDRFRQGAEQLGLPLMASSTPIQPVVLGESDKAVQASERLREKGFIISAIRPPTVPKDTSRLRITFSASHEDQHIDMLLDELNHVLNRQCADT